ncbi:hypothetical protein QYM36_000276 [Artemia franciscana]|uniref:Saposin n=1 Tax=Artemia franciscana TaxID=6661 RepID=A0AA88LJ65_ARTSF|nr:hypothetical protein QYM36_000276 [Artemia franciscana]
MKGICASTLLVFGLLSLGSCSVLVKNHGKDRNPSCYKGPEYWCQNLNSAKECGAVKHCSQTTWLHKKLPEDKEDICQICMEMVQEARDQLISNETQDELRQVFEGSCKLILVKAIRKECMKLADEFIPELVDMLASQMNPQMVCATAGLCNSERINRLWLDYKSAKLSGRAEEEEEPERSNPIPGGCDDCRRFIEDTKTIIETHSKEEVLERLLYICDQAQSYADACKYAIVENFPEIYEVLTTDLDSNKICKLVGMCDESLASSVKVVTKGNQDRFTRINDDMECEFCEAMVNHVRDLMNNTTTEDEFLQIMEGLCHASKKEDKCLQFVHRYYKAAYAFVLNELHPRELCSTIGLCKGNVLDRPLWIPIMGGSEDYEQKLASMLSPAKDPESGDELFGEKESADLQSFDSSLLGILSPMAMLPMVEMKPAKELDSIPMVKMTPAEPVHPYKKEDIDELLAGFPASLFEKNYRPNLAADELKNKPFCSICELAMHDLENVLANADEDKKIEELVMDACERLPSSLRKQCDAFISQYGDSVLFILSQQLDPSIVCPRLNLCLKVELSNEIDHFPEWSPPKDVSDIKDCALCHFTVSEVEKRLHTPRTKESIIKELELVCDRLPASLHGQCDDFVTENAPKIIDMLIQEYTPEKICVFLKMCEPKPRDLTLGDFLKKIEEPKWRPLSKIEDMLKLVGDELDQLGMEERFNFAEEEEAKEKQEETNNPLCVMCEFAMAKIDRLLITNATEVLS